MKILCLNARRMENSGAFNDLKDLLVNKKKSWLSFYRKQSVPFREWKLLKVGCSFENYFSRDSCGRSGGLILL